MPRAFITSRGRTGVSFGCLGTLILGIGYLLVAAVVGLAIAAVVAAVVTALVVALLALVVHRVLMLTSSRYRARRGIRGPFRPVSKVVDTTASVLPSRHKEG